MMQSVGPKYLIITCAAFALQSGCHSVYAPYRGSMPVTPVFPGTMPYQAPIQTLTPGTTPYVPNGQFQQYQYPSTIPQGGPQPTYTPPSGGLQPIPDNGPGSNAPGYTNPGSGVPDPYYPQPGLNSTQFQPPVTNGVLQPIQPAAMQGLSPLNPPPSSLREVNATPINPYTNQSIDDGFAPPIHAPPASDGLAQPLAPNANSYSAPRGSDPFAAPAEFDAPQAMPLMREDLQANKVSFPTEETFAHEPQFRWVRGVISQDPQQQSWSIIYDDNPTNSDALAGHLSLSPSPHLDSLKDGDVVQIEGEVDSLVRDTHGKPIYVVSHVRRISSSAR